MIVLGGSILVVDGSDPPKPPPPTVSYSADDLLPCVVQCPQ